MRQIERQTGLGGSTQRLHHKYIKVYFCGGETGSTGVD